jgi:hypothetical protein
MSRPASKNYMRLMGGGFTAPDLQTTAKFRRRILKVEGSAFWIVMAADSLTTLVHGDNDGEKDNAEPSADEGRGAHAEGARARRRRR